MSEIAKILLPMNSDGKSIRVTGPAVIQAPNMKWELLEGESAYLDVEDEADGRPWGWRMTMDNPKDRNVRTKDNKVWTVCGNCDAVSAGHSISRHCGELGNLVLGDDPHEAPIVECGGGSVCCHERVIAWRMISGHIRVLNVSRVDLVVSVKDGERRYRALLAPLGLSAPIEGMGGDVEIASSEDTSSMHGKITLVGGEPGGGE